MGTPNLATVVAAWRTSPNARQWSTHTAKINLGLNDWAYTFAKTPTSEKVIFSFNIETISVSATVSRRHRDTLIPRRTHKTHTHTQTIGWRTSSCWLWICWYLLCIVIHRVTETLDALPGRTNKKRGSANVLRRAVYAYRAHDALQSRITESHKNERK